MQPGTTLWYVVSNLTVDSNDTSPAAGFNLDGLVGGIGASGCGFADRVSDLDASENAANCNYQQCNLGGPGCPCVGGVDNHLPWLTDAMDTLRRTSMRDRLQASLRAGQVVILARLSDLDDLVDDPSVHVSLYRGWLISPSCASLAGGQGHFLVDAGSLTNPDDITTSKWTFPGSISGGRLRAGGGAMQYAGAGYALAASSVKLAFNPSLNGGTDGNFGAALLADSLRLAIVSFYPTSRSALNGIIPELADQPDASGVCGGSWGAPVGAMGAGVRFALANAVIDGVGSAGPTTGCN